MQMLRVADWLGAVCSSVPALGRVWLLVVFGYMLLFGCHFFGVSACGWLDYLCAAQRFGVDIATAAPPTRSKPDEYPLVPASPRECNINVAHLGTSACVRSAVPSMHTVVWTHHTTFPENVGNSLSCWGQIYLCDVTMLCR
mmetsp:Transcript_76434/g.127343  ORF Transcript_76434/g.127343 Transcript_76434/m.127343 type:complete len:141 (+) Transcript_76434:107-529(+)